MKTRNRIFDKQLKSIVKYVLKHVMFLNVIEMLCLITETKFQFYKIGLCLECSSRR